MNLRIKHPVGLTIGLAFFWIALILCALEIPARNPAIEAQLPAQGMGSAHRQFEIQLDRLIIRADQGPVDCILIGNSHVLRGIDPQSIEDEYKTRTGQSIRCQNFGLRGTSMELNGIIAPIIAEKFHPKILILGVALLDMDTTLAGKGDKNILESPWVRYRLGEPLVEGWMIDQLYSYRYYLGINNTYFSRIQLTDADGAAFDSNIQANGFNPSASLYDPTNMPADRVSDLRETYSAVAIDGPSQQGIKNILALQEQGIEVVIVEMPVVPFAIDLSPKIAARHQAFIETLTNLANGYNRIFWQTQGSNFLTAESWSDHNHLNQTGAEIFSRWLADQMVDAMLSGTIYLHGSNP